MQKKLLDQPYFPSDQLPLQLFWSLEGCQDCSWLMCEGSKESGVAEGGVGLDTEQASGAALELLGGSPAGDEARLFSCSNP